MIALLCVISCHSVLAQNYSAGIVIEDIYWAVTNHLVTEPH